MIVWMLLFGPVLSVYAYSRNIRFFVRYVKYANPKSELNKKMFLQVK